MRECLPLILFVRNRLKYALTYNEARMIMKQRLIKVDGKVRTDMNFPAGFMGKPRCRGAKTEANEAAERETLSQVNGRFICLDVVTIEKTGEHFRLIYDVKGRYAIHRITPEEAQVPHCLTTQVCNYSPLV